MASYRAVVVDDHPLVRMAVKILLSDNGYTVIAESSDGVEALELVKTQKPDVLVIDVDIPRIDGIEVVKILRRRDYEGIIIMISGKNAEYYAPLCAAAGANGFVSKKNNLPEIISALQAGINGYNYFPRATPSLKLADDLGDKAKIDDLSSQEFRVFQLLVEGLANASIAQKLNISNKTVSTYKTRLMGKLSCSSIKELFEFARKNNLD